MFPYVSIGQASAADWSTGSEAGAEHTLVLHAWSRAAGKKESYAIVAAIEGALHDASLGLDGHHLGGFQMVWLHPGNRKRKGPARGRLSRDTGHPPTAMA